MKGLHRSAFSQLPRSSLAILSRLGWQPQRLAALRIRSQDFLMCCFKGHMPGMEPTICAILAHFLHHERTRSNLNLTEFVLPPKRWKQSTRNSDSAHVDHATIALQNDISALRNYLGNHSGRRMDPPPHTHTHPPAPRPSHRPLKRGRVVITVPCGAMPGRRRPKSKPRGVVATRSVWLERNTATH